MGMTNEQQKLMEERMIKVMKEDPTITVKALAQRFGCTVTTVRRIQRDAGLRVAGERGSLLSRKDMKKANVEPGFYPGGKY